MEDLATSLAIANNQKHFLGGQRGTGSVTASSFLSVRRSQQAKVEKKTVTIYVDTSIEFEVDITDPSNTLTCGWLLDKAKELYDARIDEIRRAEAESAPNPD